MTHTGGTSNDGTVSARSSSRALTGRASLHPAVAMRAARARRALDGGRVRTFYNEESEVAFVAQRSEVTLSTLRQHHRETACHSSVLRKPPIVRDCEIGDAIAVEIGGAEGTCIGAHD